MLLGLKIKTVVSHKIFNVESKLLPKSLKRWHKHCHLNLFQNLNVLSTTSMQLLNQKNVSNKLDCHIITNSKSFKSFLKICFDTDDVERKRLGFGGKDLLKS